MRRSHAVEPVLITTAPSSNDDEFDRRRKRYAIMMATRAVCVVVAALTYRYSLWLALVCVIAGAVLPWCAVIIANDRPPKSRQAVVTHAPHSNEPALTAGEDEHPIVDG